MGLLEQSNFTKINGIYEFMKPEQLKSCLKHWTVESMQNNHF